MAEQRLTLEEIQSRFRDMRPLLTQLGAAGIARAQRAFREKRYGNTRWPTRYPGMPEPFINIAAALSDLNRGFFVRPQRFDREPVLRGLSGGGGMLASVNAGIEGRDTVWVGWKNGPAASYAGKHQLGERDSQPIKSVAKKKYREQLKKLSGSKREALQRMGFVEEERRLVTRVHARPSVGYAARVHQEDVRELISAYGEGREL